MHLAEEFSQHVHEAEEGVSRHAHQYPEDRYSLDQRGNGLQSNALKKPRAGHSSTRSNG